MARPKFICCPEGWAVRLDSVDSVSTVEKSTTGLSFKLYLSSTRVEHFNYPYASYAETEEELLSKVQNIRNQLLRMLNDDEMPATINASIDLTKKSNATTHGE